MQRIFDRTRSDTDLHGAAVSATRFRETMSHANGPTSGHFHAPLPSVLQNGSNGHRQTTVHIFTQLLSVYDCIKKKTTF